MASKPTVVIVPGAFQLPSGYMPFAEVLKQAGFDAEVIDKPSTGRTELPLPGLPEDIEAIRKVIIPLIDAGKEVVILAHSAGGVSSSGAVKGLDVNSRKAAGLPGGVTRLIYMAAAMVPKGKSMLELLGGKNLHWMFDHVGLDPCCRLEAIEFCAPFRATLPKDGMRGPHLVSCFQSANRRFQGDRVMIDAESMPEIGMNDLSPEEQKKWCKEMSHTSSALFAGISEFEPWNEGVPCAFILCELDNAMVYPLQQKMAAELGPDGVTVTLNSGHCPFLSKKQELLEAVEKIVTAGA